LTSFYSPAPTPVIPPRHVEVQPEGPEPIEPEQVETGVSNVNADNVETEEIDPNVALNDGDIIADCNTLKFSDFRM
jgi:hypothetical protein